MSNSNFNITKVTVDPVSQEITNLEINGKAVETGSSNLQEESIRILTNGTTLLTPDEGYDGFSSVEITTEVASAPSVLMPVTLYECDQDGGDIEDPQSLSIYAKAEINQQGIYYNTVIYQIVQQKEGGDILELISNYNTYFANDFAYYYFENKYWK